MKLFQTIINENLPVELTIFTPNLGYFVIQGAYEEVLPSYEQIVREENRGRQRSGRGLRRVLVGV